MECDNKFLEIAFWASYYGGQEILSVYNSDIAVEIKADNSPVTIADKKSNRAIVDTLKRFSKTIPIISEELEVPSYNERKHWDRFWIIDPLDGTSEFINQSKDFGVMVALINKKHPIVGSIYFPGYDSMYFAQLNLGAYKLDNCFNHLPKGLGFRDVLKYSTKLGQKEPFKKKYTILQSKSHLCAADLEYYNQLKNSKDAVESIQLGSCLKFAHLAEGKADEYTRVSNMHEWDVAAGQAIVENAGANFLSFSGEKINYNTESLIIKGFKAVWE